MRALCTNFTTILHVIGIDECLSHPCENGGACKDGTNRYTCQCTYGYMGDNCEKRRSDTHIIKALRTSTFVINHLINASILETCYIFFRVENRVLMFLLELHFIYMLTMLLIPPIEIKCMKFNIRVSYST